MSEQAAAARAITKAGKMYRSSEWDLVDALESGVKLDEVDAKDLPAPMRTIGFAWSPTSPRGAEFGELAEVFRSAFDSRARRRGSRTP